MDQSNIMPLNVSICRGVINGAVYDIVSQEEYLKYKTNNCPLDNLAVKTNCNGEEIILPVQVDKQYSGNNITPGIYPCGPMTVFKYPKENEINKYKPTKIVEFNNSNSIEEVLEKKEILENYTEPWVSTTDNATLCSINSDDQPEMRAIKSALNAKHIDIDSYAYRFGNNFPNNKRQLKNNSATLKFIKTFCDALDMDAELIIKDKEGKIPNPMNKVIHVSLTDLTSTDDIVQ